MGEQTSENIDDDENVTVELPSEMEIDEVPDPGDYSANQKLIPEVINLLLSKQKLMANLPPECETWKYRTLPHGSKKCRNWLGIQCKEESCFLPDLLAVWNFP